MATTATGPADQVLERARQSLRDRHYRVDVADGAVAAEKGHLRETGNLVFHLALLLLLVAVALGHLAGYKANVLVVEGEAFSNTVSAYDTWTPGPLADDDLAPFTVELADLRVRYQRDGMQAGAPRDFRALVRYTADPDAPERTYDLRVNHPLKVDGVKVFLLGNGYAPVFTVRDRDGAVVSRGPAPFLPRDGNNTSSGVLKVTGTSPQLGFDGLFLPTAVIDELGPHSVYPGLQLPRAFLSVWRGDLGVDSGTPQSVYSLDKDGLDQVRGDGGRKLVVGLAPGTSATLPSGETITMDGVRRWASLQVAHDPGTGPALAAALLALAGLMASLFVRRRRVWVKVVADGDGRTLVEVAGLARTEGEGGDGLADELRELAAEIGDEQAPAPAGTDDGTGAARDR